MPYIVVINLFEILITTYDTSVISPIDTDVVFDWVIG
jgi:hypothetical protein